MTSRRRASVRPTRSRRGQDGRRKQLSEKEIIDAALALTRRLGVQGVTMRALATELGVTPMAVYYYLPNKQALLDLVANTVLSRASIPGPEAGTWEDRLWAFISENMRELAKYPGLGEYLQTTELTPAGKHQVEESIALLREAGLSSAAARKAYSAIYAHMYGRIMFQSMLGKSHIKRTPPPTGSTRALRLEELASEEHIEFGYRVLAAGIKDLLE